MLRRSVLLAQHRSPCSARIRFNIAGMAADGFDCPSTLAPSWVFLRITTALFGVRDSNDCLEKKNLIIHVLAEVN